MGFLFGSVRRVVLLGLILLAGGYACVSSVTARFDQPEATPEPPPATLTPRQSFCLDNEATAYQSRVRGCEE